MVESKTSLLKNLGHRIAVERKKRGLTLEKLAYEMDISKGNLSDIENGKKGSRYSTLIQIAQRLEVSVSKLLKDL